MYDEDWRCLLPPSVVWSPGGSMLLDLVATALPFPYTLTGMIQSYFAHFTWLMCVCDQPTQFNWSDSDGSWFNRNTQKQWRYRTQFAPMHCCISALMGAFAEDMFRSKYEELKQRAEEAKSKKSALQTDQYEERTLRRALANAWYLSHVSFNWGVTTCKPPGQSEARTCSVWRSQTNGQAS